MTRARTTNFALVFSRTRMAWCGCLAICLGVLTGPALASQWSGDAQLRARSSQGDSSEVREFDTITLAIIGTGKVSGSTVTSGCTFEGLTTHSFIPQVVNLDVLVRNCQNPVFNGAYTGSFIIPKSSSGRLSLARYKISAPAWTMTITANLE